VLSLVMMLTRKVDWYTQLKTQVTEKDKD